MENKAEGSFEGSENYGRKKMVIASITLITVFMLSMSGCKKSDELAMMDGEQSALTESMRSSFTTLYLVSDVASYHPVHIDPRLVNAWGMEFASDGKIWVNATESGSAEVYDIEGNTLRRPVAIPGTETREGNPTGIVQNPTSEAFIIPATGEVSQMIFSTENGTIAAIGSGTEAVTVVDRSFVHAVYKGLAVAKGDGGWYLYATDFYNGRVDVFNDRFELVVRRMFTDPRMPAGFAPFGIRGFDSKLIVTYALQSDDREDDVAGMGNGYVDLYKADGTFIRRFASEGRLNSPWGIEMFIPNHRMTPQTELNSDVERRSILIGNFGDGHINVYDQAGNFMGQLQNHNEPITIEGLWAISYRPTRPEMSRSDGRLYFTAGPADETHGLFGYIINN